MANGNLHLGGATREYALEHANISINDKAQLLDALSETGLKRIVIGSFVSPKWTPQMARIDDLVKRFHSKKSVAYTALAPQP